MGIFIAIHYLNNHEEKFKREKFGIGSAGFIRTGLYISGREEGFHDLTDVGSIEVSRSEPGE